MSIIGIIVSFFLELFKTVHGSKDQRLDNNFAMSIDELFIYVMKIINIQLINRITQLIVVFIQFSPMCAECGTSEMKQETNGFKTDSETISN